MPQIPEHTRISQRSRRVFMLLASSLALLMCMIAVAAIFLTEKSPTNADLSHLLQASENVQRSAESRARAVQLTQSGKRPPFSSAYAARLRAADSASGAQIVSAARHLRGAGLQATGKSQLLIARLAASDRRATASHLLMLTYGVNDSARLAALSRAQTVLIKDYARNVGNSSRAIRADITTTRKREEKLDTITIGGLLTGGALALLVLVALTRSYIHISRREQALSHSLRDLEHLQQLMLIAVDEGVIGLDLNGTIVFANPAAERLTGCAADDLLGVSCEQVLSLFDSKGGARARESCMAKLIEVGELDLITGWCQTIGEREFFAELVLNPIWVNEKIDGAVLLLRDITKRHDSEQMKDDLLAVVGHELRTPLTSIRGSLGLLAVGAAGDLSSDSERLISIAGDNTERLMHIVEDLLDMGRLDRRRLRMDLRATLVVDMCQGVASSLADTAQRHKVNITCAVDEDDLCAVLDPDLMQRVVSNLLDNAVRMSPERGRVDLRISRVDEGWCRIEVIDDGPGVPDKERERIFDRFVQVDSGDARQNGGLGLGLALCTEIVELHAGHITVDRAPGRGARFRCDIPLAGPVSLVSHGAAV